MFTFDLISSLVESSITKKKKMAMVVSCFLATILKANYEELHFSKDSVRLPFADCTVQAVPQTRFDSTCGTWDKTQVPESYSAWDPPAGFPGTITVIRKPSLREHGEVSFYFKCQIN